MRLLVFLILMRCTSCNTLLGRINAYYMDGLVKFDANEILLYRTTVDPSSTSSLNGSLQQQRQRAGNGPLHFLLAIRQHRYTTHGNLQILGPGFVLIAANFAL